MSGHSKWASIKHKKAATDARRGQLFTKLARAITIAAREGGGDPDANFTLAAAIAEGARLLDAQGQHPAGDRPGHRSRGRRRDDRAGRLRGLWTRGRRGARRGADRQPKPHERRPSPHFDKNSGSLGEPGSVAWVFEKRGVVMVDADRYTEDDLIAAIDAGAEDVAREGDSLKVVSAAEDLAAVRGALESAGVDIESAELTMEPKNVVEVGEARRPRRDAPDGGARRARRRRGRPREFRHPGRHPGGNRGEGTSPAFRCPMNARLRRTGGRLSLEASGPGQNHYP